MHKEILNENQEALLNIVKHFSSKGFYLARGTALALQIGHRESIDFDLFFPNKFDNQDTYKELISLGLKTEDLDVQIDKLDEYTLFIKDTKITFLRYPFLINDIKEEEDISFADKLTIGAMKAYALGRRGKWKDYVDLYILFKESSLKDLIQKAESIFSNAFSEKMFVQQLCYFEDIDFSEKVIWKIDNPPSDDDIKTSLEEIATGKY